jgi:hypothetical protein
MAQPLNVSLRNATGHRHVFSVTDNVCQTAIVNNLDLDDDETRGVQLCRDDSDRGSVTYTMVGQIGGRKDNIQDGDTVNMD